MLEKLLKIYASFMVFGTTGLMPHLVGPPGSGKSSVVEELAELLGVQLHIINVSRLSPLEVEGVQMPIGEGRDMALHMLPATFWTRLQEGDIILFDEFLRGFPEVYSSLLDIFTSRRAGAYCLPKVLMIGASNSVIAYDEALQDRLLHIPVADPRNSKTEQARLAQILVDQIGLHPGVVETQEMEELITKVVLPTFDVLDTLTNKKSRKVQAPRTGGKSIRNLISQVHLRNVITTELKLLIEESNRTAMNMGKHQFVVLLGNEKLLSYYEKPLLQLQGNPRLTHVQQMNLEINIQLIGLAAARKEKVE